MIIPLILVIIMIIIIIRAGDARGIPSLLLFPCSLAHFHPKWTNTEHLHGVNDHAGSHRNPCFMKVSRQGAESSGGHSPA